MSTIIEMFNLKNQLKAYLEQMDISAAKLARQSGVSKQTLSYWLSGGSPRGLEQVKKVASTLGTTVDHLCFGVGIETEQSKNKKNSLDLVFGDDEWITGLFEIKVRRLK